MIYDEDGAGSGSGFTHPNQHQHGGHEHYHGRVYFDAHRIDDSLLKNIVTKGHIAKSSQYIEDLAYSLGVRADAIQKPAPFIVRELAEAYALMEAAEKKAMMNTDARHEGADAYELKRRVYAEKVKNLRAQITARTLTGGQSAKQRAFPMSVPLYRG